MELYEKTSVCAQDKSPQRVVKWLRKVERVGVGMDDLIKPGTEVETLDRKLALALQSIIPRDLEIRVNTEKTTQLEKKRVLITGRQVLWLIYRHFQTNPNQTKVYGITELATIRWFGERKNAKFLNFWNERMALAAGRTQYWMKAEILYSALKESQDLRLDMLAYHQKSPINTGGAWRRTL